MEAAETLAAPVAGPDRLRCHRCLTTFQVEDGPIANRWAPASLAMCMRCMQEFFRETWERGF